MVVSEEKCFLAGVVEGFYGRPWSCFQRRELFSRMRRSSLNMYIYAPKDDVKHRALWRQLYTKEEENKIKVLIDAAAEENVVFVYAISPGLDISFSSPADVAALKKKMKQVSKLGCKAFALLFDDINPTLKPRDAVVYHSSAHAQASLTNELYIYLKRPQFLFCPTEYCKTRALPTVRKSEYLCTLGKELCKEIDIMWTGDKVIPEIITKESIIELGEVLQRKPVIWDNIHANDYDQRRVFLGAYCGRPLELYPYLNGVLTNPNCEFEANFIPIHTLGTWCRTALNAYGNLPEDVSLDDVPMTDLSEANTPKTENVNSLSDSMDMLPSLTVDDIDSVVAEYDPKEALRMAIQDWIEEFNIVKKPPLKSYSKRNLKSSIVNGQTVLTAVPFELDIAENTIADITETMCEDKSKCMNLTDDNIHLLTDLFCLPYGHGEFGERLYKEFEWLLQNVADIYEQPPSKEKVSNWFDRLLRCDEHCQEVYNLFENFCKIPNEAILYDLYPYIWDLKEIVLSLDAYLHWMSDSITSSLSYETVKMNLQPEAFAPIPTFMSDYTEPWHISYLGGLTISLHRLLPFKGGFLFLDQAPDKPSNNMFKIRSYVSSDQKALYEFCAQEGSTDAMLDIEQLESICEAEIGSYKNLCPKTLFIIEDKNRSLCGYIAAVPNNFNFSNEYQDKWLPSFQSKYVGAKSGLFTELPEWRLANASHITFRLSSSLRNECVFRRILHSVFSILKTYGSTTIYHELRSEDDFDLFLKLGFYPVDNIPERIMWRIL